MIKKCRNINPIDYIEDKYIRVFLNIFIVKSLEEIINMQINVPVKKQSFYYIVYKKWILVYHLLASTHRRHAQIKLLDK